MTFEFASANQIRWSNFLKKMNLETNDSVDFATIIEKIWIFLQHPLQASINKTELNNHWIPRKGWK